MKKVRVGIIGLGNMGGAHAADIVAGKTPELELVAVADTIEESREWAAQNLPKEVAFYGSGSELIQHSDCEAVIIATPHYSHPTLAIEAFEHGKHVLSEKPAGVYTKAVAEMNAAAAKSGKTFAVMFNQRTNSLYRKMHDMIADGELGQIKRVNWIVTNWYRTQLYYDSGNWRATWAGEGGGVLLNQSPHQLDLLQWICGLPSSVVSFCHEGKWHDIEVEDDVTAYLEYPNGATGVFITTTGDFPGTNRFEVTGEYGSLVCENNELIFNQLDVNERVFCKESTQVFGQPNCTTFKVEVDGIDTHHVGIMNSFASNILHGTPLLAKGEEGIRSLMLTNAIQLSSWLNKKVALPIDEDLFLEELNKRRVTSRLKTKVVDVRADTRSSYNL